MHETFAHETFKQLLRSYFWKWSIPWAIVMVSTAVLVSLVALGPLNLESKRDVSFEGDVNFEGLAAGHYATGRFAIGTLLGVGILGSGGITAIGLMSFGLVTAIGIVAIGGCNAFGIVAIGGTNAFGIIAIGLNAWGVIAIGWHARGIFALSYSGIGERKPLLWAWGTGEGKYPLSPRIQDASAVAFFTRWLPKLKAAFAPAIH